MKRRDCLKLAAVGAGLAAAPAFAAGSASNLLIYDGRFPEAVLFARQSGQAFDCQADAATLWFAHFAGKPELAGGLSGLTTAADALVLADCARREGLGFVQLGRPTPRSGLVAWQISGRSRP